MNKRTVILQVSISFAIITVVFGVLAIAAISLDRRTPRVTQSNYAPSNKWRPGIDYVDIDAINSQSDQISKRLRVGQ